MQRALRSDCRFPNEPCCATSKSSPPRVCRSMGCADQAVDFNCWRLLSRRSRPYPLGSQEEAADCGGFACCSHPEHCRWRCSWESLLRGDHAHRPSLLGTERTGLRDLSVSIPTMPPSVSLWRLAQKSRSCCRWNCGMPWPISAGGSLHCTSRRSDFSTWRRPEAASQ